MAPIPEHNKEKIPDEDSTEIDMFSNPNLSVTQEISDSSDENDNDPSNINDIAGYTLLSQEPIEAEDYDEEDDNFSLETERDANKNNGDVDKNSVSSSANNERTDPLSDSVYQSEGAAMAQKGACHPAFLAKFPDGKIPSYLQVPPLRPDMKEQIWNQKTQGENSISIDSGQESRILKAMAGFSLPQEHIPDWAKDMSDDQWKRQVLEKIKCQRQGRQTILQNRSDVQIPQQVASENKSDTKNYNWVATFPDS